MPTSSINAFPGHTTWGERKHIFSSTFWEEALLLDGFLGAIDSRNPAINPHRAMEFGLELKCKGEQIVPVQTVNNRGIIVDKYFTFACQVERVCNKAHGKVETFRHGGRNMTTADRRTFYLSIIQSTLDYASSAYFYCLHTNTYNKILTTSRNCIRRIFGLHRCTHFNLVQQKYNLHVLHWELCQFETFCFRLSLSELAN